VKLEIKIDDYVTLYKLIGSDDRYLKTIRNYLGTKIIVVDNNLVIDVDDNNKNVVEVFFDILLYLINKGLKLKEVDIIYIIRLIKKKILKDEILDFYLNRKVIVNSNGGNPIFARTINQKEYIESIKDNLIVFGSGPAGTGKTYLAIAYAVKLLKENKIKKIVLTRPAVEAGEELGFLPGDLKDKVDPYLIPIYDSLHDFFDMATIEKFITDKIIEIAPLAFMRGRTFDNALIVLDEAQNTTITQMKMFLTRIGFNSKMIITGDPLQIDINKHSLSGFKDALVRFSKIKEIKILEFEKIDIIRNPLIYKILECYENEN